MNISERVKKLGLPLGEYVVVGGAMEAHGIRPAKDIDIVATAHLFNKLISDGWKMCECADCASGTKKILKGDGVDIISEFSCKDKYYAATEDLIKNADVIDGVPFVQLGELRKWKVAYGREKDIKDVELIDEYLNTK